MHPLSQRHTGSVPSSVQENAGNTGSQLALGIGLVIMVTAASSGVKSAQAKVLASLYGVGTDVTVTKRLAPRSTSARSAPDRGRAL